MKMKRASKIYTAIIMVFLFAPIAILLVFSFNEALGGLTAEAGFAVAPVNPDDEATAEMCGQVIYPSAVTASSAHAAEAAAFLAYLQGADAAAIFARVGFTSLTK